MTESSNPEPDRPNTPPDLHWGISYLREDIQDMRQDIKDARHESRTENRETNERMDARFAEVNERIAEVNRRVDSRFALLMTLMMAMTGVLLAAIKL